MIVQVDRLAFAWPGCAGTIVMLLFLACPEAALRAEWAFHDDVLLDEGLA
jgi:hypothetical protein